MNVTVYGVGWLGSSLAIALRHIGYELTVVDDERRLERVAPLLDRAGVRIGPLHKADVIVWAGGRAAGDDASLRRSVADALDLLRLETAAPVVYLSSVHAEQPTIYGRAKLLGETICARRKNSMALRLGTVLGPGRPTPTSVVEVFLRQRLEGHRLVSQASTPVKLVSLDRVVDVVSCAINGRLPAGRAKEPVVEWEYAPAEIARLVNLAIDPDPQVHLDVPARRFVTLVQKMAHDVMAVAR